MFCSKCGQKLNDGYTFSRCEFSRRDVRSCRCGMKYPFSLLTGGNIFLSGILLPIAAFKVARRILLKNGFKALSPA